MLLSFTHRFIFVHVYKVAGTSVVKALEPFAHRPEKLLANRVLGKLNRVLGTNLGLPYLQARIFPDHLSARELKQALPARLFDDCFKFAFVRNPWDWQVSLYHYMRAEPSHWQHDFARTLPGFDAYLDWRVHHEKRLQKDFLTDESGKFLVDFVGRFERLDQDFRHVCQVLNLEVDLPCLNRSAHQDYRTYYDERLRTLIELHFREDIEAFGYTFDNDRRKAG